MSNALTTLTNKLAARLEMGDGAGLVETLKATAFKGQVSDAQMTALMVVANQYGLNPWTKEIYAFPDKNNGIVPVVGVDGWSRIMNEHPQFDGMEFEQTDDACTCRIFRKDRSRPIVITEYMSECKRANVGPWQSHPRRMLRHKAMIQCARLAFGFGGIYDQDEAERIVEKDVTQEGSHTVSNSAPKQLPPYPDAEFDSNLPAWRKAIADGRATPEQIIGRACTRYALSAEQAAAIRRPENVSTDGVIDCEFTKAYEAAAQGE
jgi:phage recombination protein Bet